MLFIPSSNHFIYFLLFLSLCLTAASPPSPPLSNHQTIPKRHNNTQTRTNSSTIPSKHLKRQHIITITNLLETNRHLHKQILYERQQNERATTSFQNSLKALSYITETRSNLQNSLHRLNRDLKEYRRQSPLYARTINILHRQVGAALLEINRLVTSKSSVIHEKALLAHQFRHRGLEHWVQNTLKDAVNPLVAGAVVEGTANVVQPVLDGIENLASVNQLLARRMTSRIGETVPIVEKPFYSGFLTYTLLLCPLVLVTSLLLKVKRGLTRLSAGHFIILGNFYFTLLSGGCFIATLLGPVDVLLTFRHVNMGMFDLVMVLHGILYMIHVSFHVMIAFRAKDNTLAIHTFLLILVGIHFFIHSYLHVIHNEDPHVDKVAYAVYTITFAYVLYNWTVKHIRMTMQTAKMKLNNKSISTVEKQALAAVTINPASPVLYRHSSQKITASSSMSNTLLDKEISRKEVTSRANIRVDNIFYSPPTALKEGDPPAGMTIAGPSTMRAIVRMNADNPKDL